jgi:hypothetical protein
MLSMWFITKCTIKKVFWKPSFLQNVFSECHFRDSNFNFFPWLRHEPPPPPPPQYFVKCPSLSTILLQHCYNRTMRQQHCWQLVQLFWGCTALYNNRGITFLTIYVYPTLAVEGKMCWLQSIISVYIVFQYRNLALYNWRPVSDTASFMRQTLL